MATARTMPANLSGESADRISVRDSPLRGSVVDGGWWPRSMNLTVELPRLLTRLWGDEPTDVRVAYHLGMWPAAPRKIFIGNRMIRLGGFVHQDPLVISLSGAVSGRRLDLLVINPATPPEVAARALRISAAADCTLTPSEILDRAAREAAASADGCPEAELVWENEGGHEIGRSGHPPRPHRRTHRPPLAVDGSPGAPR